MGMMLMLAPSGKSENAPPSHPSHVGPYPPYEGPNGPHTTYNGNHGNMNANGNMNAMNAMNSMNGNMNTMGPQQSYPVNAGAGMQAQMLIPGLPSLTQAQARAMGFTADYEDYDTEARRGRSRSTGRYTHRAGADYDMEMQMHGGGGGEDDEEMGMGAVKPKGGALKMVLKMLKGMEGKLEDLQEALEEHAEKKGKKKKKKSKPEDDEDDDEDDPAEDAEEGDGLEAIHKALSGLAESKEFMSALPVAVETMLQVLSEPPQTWNTYLEKGELAPIVLMESKELAKAIAAYSLKQREAKDVFKEITHTGAALLLLYASLLHGEGDE